MPLGPAYGLPGTRVIPEDWSGRHEPVAEDTHGAAISLRRPAATTAGFDYATKRSTPQRQAPYAALAYADISYEPRAEGTLTTGEERQPTGLYRVAVATDLDTRVDDLVTVLASLDDPLLEGRDLRVDQVLLGGHRFERDLLCVLLPLATT